MNRQAVSEKLVKVAQRAILDVTQATIEKGNLLMPTHPSVAEAGINAVLPELEAEWRERLLSDEVARAMARHRHELDHAEGFDDRLWDRLSDPEQHARLADARNDLAAALAATQHSGQESGE